MYKKIKQAVILSAGLGTRLRPLTDNIPKVMVAVAGKPILGWHAEQFAKHGVDTHLVNLHYLPDVITNYLGDGSDFGVKTVYSHEAEILGTAGGVKQFQDKLDDVFFVMYGDMFSLVDYSKMAETFFRLPEDALGMMIVGRNDHPHDSDLVEVDPVRSRDLPEQPKSFGRAGGSQRASTSNGVDDNISRFLKIHKKPHEYRELPENFRTLDAGYIFRKKILDYVPYGKYYEIDRELLPDIVSGGEKFYGYETEDYLYDIGTMERYRAVEEYAKNLKAGS